MEQNRPKQPKNTNHIDEILRIIDTVLLDSEEIAEAYKQHFIETGELPEVNVTVATL